MFAGEKFACLSVEPNFSASYLLEECASSLDQVFAVLLITIIINLTPSSYEVSKGTLIFKLLMSNKGFHDLERA